ncbi:Fic family protein [uncultured Alsobacter sp.]|uniref:Fic family protein n=1 Tax=uncultured Alsobacter sp. TaxID=1748258 RepID=UPI0025FB530A|nr:Fic family protein [uncultured Alsobacter sp.]
MSYIHQSSAWPALSWDEGAIAPLLADVRHRQGRLFGRMEGLGLAARSEAMLKILTEDVLKTSEIEGEILDRDQVRSSLARRLGLEIGALVAADRHVDGVVEMMLDATQNSAKSLTEDRLFGWHAALFPTGWSGMHRVAVGRWRDDGSGPMQVVSGTVGRERVHYEAPAARRVPVEMAAFLTWFNGPSDIDPVLKSGLAHLWFVTIHPFEDGNGRIARAIADMQLARSEGSTKRFYSMSAQIRTERRAYYEILEATQRGQGDVTAWLTWFLSCLGRAIDGADHLFTAVLRKARFWQQHAAAPLNLRQRDMLNRLLDGFEGHLTTSKWAKIQRCSSDTGLRDVSDLVERGLLAKAASGGRSTHYVLAEF